MSQIIDVMGIVFVFIGVAFSVLGVIGVLRLPDTYSRLHASGKTSILGVLFISLGTAFILPSATLKIIALSIFVIFSGPVGSHAIAAAVHRGTAIHNREALESGDVSLTEESGIHSKEYIDSLMRQIEERTQRDSES